MTARSTLWTRFLGLAPNGESGVVSAIRCGEGKEHLLVRGARGEPALLLSSEPRTTPRADIRLKHVGVFFDRRFEVANSQCGGVDVGNFCKLTCEPLSPHLHPYFVELMAATANAHEGRLGRSAVDAVVDALLEMFRKLSMPEERSVKGLWGELLLIHLAAAPEKFVNAWHLRTTDGFDFAFEDRRIEVKATERPSREHEFSLRQVRTGRSTDLLASVVLSRSSAGLSILDLTRVIADRLDLAHQGKLWRLVLATLGDDDAEADEDQRFDVNSASGALVFVRASDIPAPDVSLEAALFVSDVRFRANITAVCAASPVPSASVLR